VRLEDNGDDSFCLQHESVLTGGIVRQFFLMSYCSRERDVKMLAYEQMVGKAIPHAF